MNTQLTSGSPWHDGERQIQASVGRVDHMAEVGRRAIRDHMPDQHREFYSQLPFVLAGVVDQNGQPWATILADRPGFIQSPDEHSLEISALPQVGDPAMAGHHDGAGIGFLGIELHTRRRNRVNGSISKISSAGFCVAVNQTMGNCPKYIQHRNFRFERDPQASIDLPVQLKNTLGADDIALIRSADSFYVASYTDIEESRQVDVSHRGGKPGFVRVDDEGELTVPDFSGNTFFNTLGNILTNGKAGLIFANYETGDVLQMTGEAALILESPEIAAFEGAERLWTFRPTKVVRRPGALPIRWEFEELSPYVADTGSWEVAAKMVSHSRQQAMWRPLKVTRIVDESTVIRSFYFEHAGGSELAPFRAGQHLPIRVVVEPAKAPVLRTYTLSSGPDDAFYRISVKREGLVSSFLHDQIKVGDVIEARAPQGTFTINPLESRPVVMLAGGVGVTPMVSMLRSIVSAAKHSGETRSATLFQASRSPEERAFDTEISELMHMAGGAIRRVRAETDESGGAVGDTFHSGRIDIALLKSILPFDDFDFYLCGPPLFMQAMYDALRGVGVRDMRIFSEAFGPASLKREKDAIDAIDVGPVVSEISVAVTFNASNETAIWEPEQGTLLELGESQGLSPEFSCRSGNCGTCSTRILNGSVAYAQPPGFEVADNEALICCAMPAATADSEPLILDL